jgi:hypothetical protein
MIARASGSAMEAGRLSRPLRGVGVITIPDAGQDTTPCVDVPLGAGVLQLLVPSVAVGVFIDCRCVADWVEVTC